MGKIISVANQKGGVGKTTTSTNLAASLAHYGCKVLLIDLDPQGNATMGSGVNKNQLKASINDVLLQITPLDTTILTTSCRYDLLPGNSDLTEAEISLIQQERKEFRLRELLTPLKAQYDYVLIDCPPSLNMLTVNALVASDSVLIPIQCEYYALEGLTGLLGTVTELCQSSNPHLVIEGLLRTMYDGRNCLTQQVSEQLMQHFESLVYKTVIPRNVRLAEAPSHGLPVLLYDKHSAGAAAYLAIAAEILQKHKAEQQQPCDVA
ncbi:MAG: ParA family protein [Gammaproteobacteria bacterium]|nr:ParA family protein [Gammaproteobacteria bacterium]